jgi:hypothetical protein
MTVARPGSCPIWISNPTPAGSTTRGHATIMFLATDTSWAPWFVIPSDNKRQARLNALTHILSKIPYEEPPRSKVKLPKRQERGDYKETDYPFRVIPEVF